MSAQKIAVMQDKETLKTSRINKGAVTKKKNSSLKIQKIEMRNKTLQFIYMNKSLSTTLFKVAK